ncbi:hypothetical protein [Spirilliplanes yamanashiensis]|uniref:DUF91 domain-containing protein n=1 Tax=Spirilliplanes yamanashiensis TaxID=42233 RepID=A0A8J3YAG3_9ACTN|nr:hypothetical protein [Spirilliplanes yamanashiensis]MDP9818083.1 hypothetical protein [Spirilliplanes yamanashiensis]GIJ04893.1 hypothetical protein Sya03_42450 [Spirilliplanes yamanashiensis]
MPLFEMTSDVLVPVPSTTFAAEQVLERADLQRLLRARIDMIVDDVLVVAEEFGAFTDARRRIDLLGVDRDGRLVVIELKRTTDGGHVELQALRYAAMVSVMTFDDLVEHHQHYLAQVEPDAVDDARTRLAEFLEDAGGEDAVLSREVRVVLVSAGFDREITTTVLWLADVYGLDIRCVKLTPYKVGERLLLDVQQIIPLPEAGELTVQIRRKQTQAREATTDGRDWTPYLITTPHGQTGPLRKRHAVLAMITGLHQAGVTAAELATAVPRSRFLPVEGILSGDQLVSAFLHTYPGSVKRLGRWFLDAPLHDGERTWVVSKMWGTNTEPVLSRLLALAPTGDFGYEPAENG